MPRLERLTQRQVNRACRQLTSQRKPELEVRREPIGGQLVAGAPELLDHIVEVERDEVREHEPIVQLGAPARQAGGVRLAPETRDQGTDQQLLRDAHASVGRHLEGPHLEKAATPRRQIRRVELVDAELRAVRVAGDVDQQVAQRAIDKPRRRRDVRRREARERDLDLVQAVVPPFINPRRLARRAEKQPGEEVRQRWVIVPVRDEASQQVGAPKERAVFGRRAAQHEMIAAASPGVASVEHELLGRQARVSGILVERRRLLDEPIPIRGRLHVHLDHTRIRRDAEMRQPRIARRRIAFEQHAHAERS